jgi:GNAT superfamily N-acetyltransferase
MRYDSSLGSQVVKSVFNREFVHVIDQILSHSEVKIACPLDDPHTITGYLIYEPPKLLHFIYVKEAFQRLGIAKALINYAFEWHDKGDEQIEYTNRTHSVHEILKSHPKFLYNPFHLFINLKQHKDNHHE